MTLDVRPFGDRAVLVQPEEALDREVTRGWALRVAQEAGACWPEAGVTPGLASVLISWPGAAPSPDGVGRLLDAAMADALGGAGSAGRVPATPRAEHLVVVRYDGPDLVEVARALGISPRELVARHTRQSWSVAAIGFAPGFAYLVGADDLFERIERRADPRRAVPSGSVAVAAGMCAVYPSASPGGWQLLGSSDVVMFDPTRTPPARLAVGDVVRFVEVL